jgi:hypothetical protein
MPVALESTEFATEAAESDTAPAQRPIANVIASVDATVDQLRADLSQREFRQFISARARATDQAWAQIRSAGRLRGVR